MGQARVGWGLAWCWGVGESGDLRTSVMVPSSPSTATLVTPWSIIFRKASRVEVCRLTHTTGFDS